MAVSDFEHVLLKNISKNNFSVVKMEIVPRDSDQLCFQAFDLD